MNAKRILNNYRAGKMPRSVYRRGGSKGRKLPMNQFFQGDEQQLMNQGSGMGQGQTMLEQQTRPDQIEVANSVLAYANQLIEQGNYKDTRKGRQKAFEDAQIAHGLVTPKQKSNFLDYFNAVTGLLGPVATTYSTIKGAKNQSNNPSMSGGMSGGMLGRMYGGSSRKLPKNRFRASDPGNNLSPAEIAMLMQGSSGTVGGTTILPETVITDEIARTFSPVSSKLLPMEQKFLAEEADLVNRMRSNPNFGLGSVATKIGTTQQLRPVGTTQQLGSSKGLGGAQQRVGQMKYGGSCRGLPGGPNEFPM